MAYPNDQAPGALNGGTPAVVSQPQSLTVDVPAGASGVSFRFRCTGSNNWYWVIDGVRISQS
ncbi:hypothetical protein [Streptomyces chartreusis]|uniref:hypothetical protein n=1 Tax=Streptomyces chartreusis TaxID=1969 RepID=UPI003626824A